MLAFFLALFKFMSCFLLTTQAVLIINERMNLTSLVASLPGLEKQFFDSWDDAENGLLARLDQAATFGADAAGFIGSTASLYNDVSDLYDRSNKKNKKPKSKEEKEREKRDKELRDKGVILPPDSPSTRRRDDDDDDDDDDDFGFFKRDEKTGALTPGAYFFIVLKCHMLQVKSFACFYGKDSIFRIWKFSFFRLSSW